MRIVERWLELELGKRISLVIAICYLSFPILPLQEEFPERFLITLVFLVCTLGFIWFSDVIGGFKGFVGGMYGGRVDKETPAVIVRIIGWAALLIPIVMFLIRVIHG